MSVLVPVTEVLQLFAQGEAAVGVATLGQRLGWPKSTSSRVLLQSAGFDSPRDAGQRIAAIKGGHYDASDPQVLRAEGVDEDEVRLALAALADAEAGKA